MAQQIALRLRADRHHSTTVAFHPTCHLETHEQQGYRLLHDLHSHLVGERSRLRSLDDVRAAGSGPLAALPLELPLFRRLCAAGVPGVAAFELALADGADAISDEEIRAYFGRILATSGE